MIARIQTERGISMSMYRATSFITEAFDEAKIKYCVRCEDGGGEKEWVEATFPVDGGPIVAERFFSTDNDNDVAVRILSLINKVPEERKARMLEACNYLNEELRHVKFSLDNRGDVNVSFDFPVKMSDECVGPVAVEVFIRSMRILDEKYDVLMKALYTEEPIGEEREMDMRMRLLQKLKSAIEKRAEAGELLPPAGPFEDDELATDENGEGAFLSGLPDDEDGEEAM